jgi:hypothetical protein
VLRAIRALGGRMTLVSLCAVVLAVSGVGIWALVRSSTSPTGKSDNVQLPVTAGGTSPTATTAPNLTSDPPVSSGDQITTSGSPSTNLKLASPNATLSRSAQPNAAVPEVSSVLLIPVVAAGLFGLALTNRNRRRRRLERDAPTGSHRHAP